MPVKEDKVSSITCQQFETMITKYIRYSLTERVFSGVLEFEEHYSSCESCLDTLQLVANNDYKDEIRK